MKNIINNKGNILGIASMVLAVASTIVGNYYNSKNMEETVKKEVQNYMNKETSNEY